MPLNPSNLLPVCLVCGETPPVGIRGGIVFNRHFLCHKCERELVGLGNQDHRYGEFVNSLKGLWEPRN